MMTLGEAVEETIRRLSEVPGTGTQTYAEELIVRRLNSAFKFLRSDNDWPYMMQWYSRTLDGVTGKVTQRIPNVLQPTDLKFIYPANSDIRLTQLPSTVNPNNVNVGTQGRWVQLLGTVDDPTTTDGRFLFALWPKTATGDVNIFVKHNRLWKSSNMDDELWLDDEAMILHACMIEVNADGANQAEQASFKQQFEDRMKQLRKENLAIPIDINPGSTTTPYSWFDPTVYFA